MTTINLALDYAMKESEKKILQTRGQWVDTCRVISEEIIMAAAASVNPDGGMTVRDARVFKGIREQLDLESTTIEVDKTQFEFLCRLFFNPTIEERLKVRPQAVRWVIQWMEYLESLR